MMNWLTKVGVKLGSQRHMVAIRDGFAGLMPLLMAGSFAVLMNNVFFQPWGLLAEFIGEKSAFIVWTSTNIAPFFGFVWSGSFAILSVALVFSIAYNLTKSYNVDGLSGGLISVGAYFILGANSGTVNFFGANGVFVAMFVAIVAPMIFSSIMNKGIVIKMPEMVPPAVGRAFAAIIPGAVAFLFFATIAYIFARVPFLQIDQVKGEEVPNTIFLWVEKTITGNLTDLLTSTNTSVFIGATVASVISLFVVLFWSVGLHGANILAPIMDGIYGPPGVENIEAFTKGAEAKYIWVRGSWDAYVFFGGSGATLALLIAILVVSKKAEDKEFARLCLPPGIFQINEPVIFGLPVVLNPIYAVPFIISQPILTFIAYVANYYKLVDPIVNSVPWVTPPVFSAFMATNFDFKAALLALFNLTLAFFIYLPFVKAANRVKPEEVTEV